MASEPTPLLALDGIRYGYPGSGAAARVARGFREHALDGVSLEVLPARRLALLGGNGAGKSTLLLHLVGVLRPDSGRLLLGGLPVPDGAAGARALRERVGLVFQDPDDQLFSGTVGRDVSFGPVNRGLPRPEVEHRVAASLAAMGIEDYAELPPHLLSHGLRKRAAIAGILAMEPSVLVLDEPTAGLDPESEDALLAALDRFLEVPGRAVVLSTHDVDLAWEWADDVALMGEGRVVGAGEARRILSDADLVRSCRLRPPRELESVRRRAR